MRDPSARKAMQNAPLRLPARGSASIQRSLKARIARLARRSLYVLNCYEHARLLADQ
jgi:hypothetical protein